jgi:hypothetical protein
MDTGIIIVLLLLLAGAYTNPLRKLCKGEKASIFFQHPKSKLRLLEAKLILG